MPKELEQYFIDSIIEHPQVQIIDNVSSEVQETRRIPDPYIFLVKDNILVTPTGQKIEDIVERQSYLGIGEFIALQKIQSWAANNTEGICVWFSPPYYNKYPVSKFIISELLTHQIGSKILFNRAVVLDVNTNELIREANRLSTSFKTQDPEILRENPIFPSTSEFVQWLDNLKQSNNQINFIYEGTDIISKMDTLATMKDVFESVKIYKGNVNYSDLIKLAHENDMTGNYQGSCPTYQQTSFETFIQQSLVVGEHKTLECTCPYCSKKVSAVIQNGKIHCPSCKKSAPYTC